MCMCVTGCLMVVEEGFTSEQVNMKEAENRFGFWFQRRMLGLETL